MPQTDITILTEEKFINPTEVDEYIRLVLEEDQMMQEALEKKGLIVNRKAWSDIDYDWSESNHVLFRTTWDYYHRFDEFIRWLGRASRQTKLINPFKLAQWNLDKHYLLDIEKKGIPTVETIFIKPLTKIELREIVEQSGWTNTVLKPAISGSARHTYKLQPHNLKNHEAIFQRLIKEESMMIQPFMKNIADKGEIALVVINGKFTHAVVKKPQLGEFRVQSEYGGSVEKFDPTPDMIELAEKTIAACPYFPIYGRIDMTWDNNDQLVVIEVEVIEPELFFRVNPESADLLAAAIIDHMN